MTDMQSTIPTNRLGVNRLAMTGALTTTLLFIFCRVAGALGFVGSHAFIALFIVAPVLSFTALCVGGVSAAIFGGIGLAAIALIYNALAPRTA